MSLQIESVETEGVMILRLKGRLVIGEEASRLQDVIEAAISEGHTRFILNFKDIAYIDSTGLGVLVVAHSAVQKTNRAIKLVHLSKRHIELLVLTKLTAIFEIYDDERMALDSFFPDRTVKPFDILEFVKSQENQPEQLGSDQEKGNSDR
jgi:anti-anti-sigma factor